MKKYFAIIVLIILIIISIIGINNVNNEVLNVTNKIENFDTVILGGNAIGLRLLASGVLVVGSDREDNKLNIGDVILEVDNVKIESNDDLIKEVNKNDKGNVNLKVLRNNKIIHININKIKEEDEYRLGLWVKDSSAGLGTITFIYNNKFASLGHPVTETRENKILPISTGGITSTNVYSIIRGYKRNPRRNKRYYYNQYYWNNKAKYI